MELEISKTDKVIIEVAKIMAEQHGYSRNEITYDTQLTYIIRIKAVLRAFLKAGYRPVFRRVKLTTNRL